MSRMNIKTNKDVTRVAISHYDIATLTKEELGELIKIGYQKSITPEFYNKTVVVSISETVGEYCNREIVRQPIFNCFLEKTDEKFYENDDYIVRVKRNENKTDLIQDYRDTICELEADLMKYEKMLGDDLK